MKRTQIILLLLAATMVVALVVLLRPLYKGIQSLKIPKTEEVELYSVVDLSLDDGQLIMYWEDQIHEETAHFSSLGQMIDQSEGEVTFATNGGMFDREGNPIGLYVQDGVELKSINQNDGYGNFHIQPNGVFYVSESAAAVVTTEEYIQDHATPTFATQSGPMLLIDGEINPQFTKGSDNVHIRSGVCAKTPRDLMFIISNRVVNFYDLAHAFQERGCTDALYLDGYVSKMYAPEIGRQDTGGAFGVILGFIKKAETL